MFQEDLHQEFQGLGQGAKKSFTKWSKALAKETFTKLKEITCHGHPSSY